MSTPSRQGIPTGVHLLFERAGEVLLMRRAGTGFFDGLYSLPGGHLEAGESVRQAARREALEELAVAPEPAQLETIGVIHRLSDSNRIDFFVRVLGWQGTPRLNEPDKCDHLAWFARRALPERTVPYVRLVLESTASEPWILEHGWP